MYVSQPTWLENGPSTLARYGAEVLRIPVPSPAMLRQKYIRQAQGLGAVPQLSAEHCASWWSMLNPLAWGGGCIGADLDYAGHKVGDVYESMQYGSIPLPGNLPAPPVPNVSATNPQITADQMDAWKRSQAAAIQAAQDSGSYNPAGNLPFTAIDLAKFWDDYGTYVLLGGAGLAGLLIWKAAVRG